MSRIIVADDCDLQLEMTSAALSAAGHTCRIAHDGQEVLSLLKSEPCDAIVTDLMMPKHDGIELIIAIRVSNSSVPIIAMTAGHMGNGDVLRRMALKLGADAALEKPVPPSDLVAAVADALSRPPRRNLEFRQPAASPGASGDHTSV